MSRRVRARRLARPDPPEADRVGEALDQRRLGEERRAGEERLGAGVGEDLLREDDVAALALALEARREVHRRPEIVEPVVERDRDAWPRVQPELDDDRPGVRGAV